MSEQATAPPPPVRGGTWVYCGREWRERDGAGRITHYSCLARFRKLKKYRQHWRRYHAGQEGDHG